MRDDGILYVCQLENVAANGDMPKQALRIINKHWFENRVVGFNRFYTAEGVNQRVDRLVRVDRDYTIQIGQYAVLGNGEQFRIDMVAHGRDINERQKMVDSKYYRQPKIVGLPYTEITLSRVEDYYDVETD